MGIGEFNLACVVINIKTQEQGITQFNLQRWVFRVENLKTSKHLFAPKLEVFDLQSWELQ